MHLKNWSLIYPDRRRAALRVSRTRRFDAFTADELSHLAAKALLPERLVLNAAHETVALFHQHWHPEKKNLPLSPAVVQAVETHLKKVPIA